MGNGGLGIINQSPAPMAEPADEPVQVDLTTKGRFTKWFLTVWKPLDMEVLSDTLTEACKWWAGQRERCPETEKLHYHFALDLKEALTFGGIKTLFGVAEKGDIWSLKVWGGAAGIQRIIQYVTKEASRVEGPWTEGNLPNKKGRAGDRMVELITTGAPDAVIAREFPFQIRNLALIREALGRDTLMTDRASPPEVWFLHGEPGTGKTRFFFDMEPDHRNIIVLKTPPRSGTWFFNGYRQQRIALFDDAAAPTEDNIVEWLKVLDRYPFIVDTKGGHVSFNSPIIGITTNLTWDQWVVALSPGHKLAIRRRVTHVREITETTLG